MLAGNHNTAHINNIAAVQEKVTMLFDYQESTGGNVLAYLHYKTNRVCDPLTNVKHADAPEIQTILFRATAPHGHQKLHE